jgi:transposase InsO family protein
VRAETIRKQGIMADQLTIHTDSGTSIASKPVALLLADLGVTRSHSRPHCSNDNHPTFRQGAPAVGCPAGQELRGNALRL